MLKLMHTPFYRLMSVIERNFFTSSYPRDTFKEKQEVPNFGIITWGLLLSAQLLQLAFFQREKIC